MVQPGLGGALDTPRTNLGDATYLSQRPDFADISQEATFVSPSKDGNLLQQLRNGRTGGVNLRTPRQRGPLADRRNLPTQSVAGAEFTPLLKSATTSSIRRRGKENGAAAMSNTPALNKIDEGDVTALPRMDTSMYTGSRNQSYMDNTMPQVDSSSVASTPLALPTRRGGDKGPLQDGNGLSLREQENVIDRIEKENFGLKLKIHFLEEALRKTGPGFSEAALKENTELKVDKVTMQRELHKYKKHLTTAERDLESYRQQMMELQEKAKRKHVDENQRAEMDELRRILEEREDEVKELQRRLSEGQNDQDRVEKLQDDIADLEADLREKDRLLSERDDELEDLRDTVGKADDQGQIEKLQDDIADLEADLREKERLLSERDDELEELRDKLDKADDQGQIEKLQDDIADLESDLQDKDRIIKEKDGELQDLRERLEAADDHDQIEKLQDDIADLEADLKEKDQILREKDRELRDRLDTASGQDQIEKLQDDIADLEADLEAKNRIITEKDDELHDLKDRLDEAQDNAKRSQRRILELEQDAPRSEELEEAKETIQNLEYDLRRLEDQLEDMKEKLDDAVAQKDRAEGDLEELQEEMANKSVVTRGLSRQIEEKVARLQDELESAGQEYAALERELAKANGENDDLRATVERLRTERERPVAENPRLHDLEVALQSRADEIKRLNDGISALQAEVRERDNLYDNDSEKWETERRALESQRQRAEEKAAGLQKTLDALRKAEGSLSDKESKLQNALASEAERHKSEEAALNRQVDDLQGALGTRQSMLTSLRNELSTVRDELSAVRGKHSSTLVELSSVREELSTIRREHSATLDELSAIRDELNNLEDQKIVLEELLDEASQHADEATKQHERAMRDMKRKLDKAERELKATGGGAHKAEQHLRMSQAEIDNLEHDIRQQQETIDALLASEASLRRKLERARSERAAYRMSAEKLQRDVQRARQSAAAAAPVKDHKASAPSKTTAVSDEALDTVVRAAEGAQERHKKELRGMVMQMEWMQARWEREASLRADAAFAKRFLQLQLDVANACNKAQLRELENIRTRLLGNRKPLSLPSAAAREQAGTTTTRPSLKTFLVMARFIARMRISARDWAKHEEVRGRLVAATEEQRKTKARRQLKVVRA
ncbi:hypothetical protein ACRE_054720 [Hapsidospora chrysogenum ATCC 11550]|uniref:Uncharacterized protein n=1 Tax=Hapsidospora chrysogenum (strain ATCC 11550 / CBS 779.69 / DSM 880 / IAM 14645 / JCM 23072 / IMI 49137) TaxID=857340 RepID=A0A086T344_HAPC1|nr:hypothetical protein ACRE_054720 [Hapsidospora chrysogenum ATCC 11550]